MKTESPVQVSVVAENGGIARIGQGRARFDFSLEGSVSVDDLRPGRTSNALVEVPLEVLRKDIVLHYLQLGGVSDLDQETQEVIRGVMDTADRFFSSDNF